MKYYNYKILLLKILHFASQQERLHVSQQYQSTVKACPHYTLDTELPHLSMRHAVGVVLQSPDESGLDGCVVIQTLSVCQHVVEQPEGTLQTAGLLAQEVGTGATTKPWRGAPIETHHYCAGMSSNDLYK